LFIKLKSLKPNYSYAFKPKMSAEQITEPTRTDKENKRQVQLLEAMLMCADHDDAGWSDAPRVCNAIQKVRGTTRMNKKNIMDVLEREYCVTNCDTYKIEFYWGAFDWNTGRNIKGDYLRCAFFEKCKVCDDWGEIECAPNDTRTNFKDGADRCDVCVAKGNMEQAKKRLEERKKLKYQQETADKVTEWNKEQAEEKVDE
jgi:hypothetical protein